MSEPDKTPDFPTPPIPCDLYTIWNTEEGRFAGSSLGTFSVQAMDVEPRAPWISAHVGVSPARLKAAEDRIKHLNEMVSRLLDRADKAEAQAFELEAEIARRDSEARREIEAGDEVEYRYLSGKKIRGVVTGVDPNYAGNTYEDLINWIDANHCRQMDPRKSLTRIGLAVLMPDGTPVPAPRGAAR